MTATITFGDVTLPREDVAERAARAASGLAAAGVNPGEVIAMMLRNDFPFLEASVAAGLVGAYVTPVNWHNTAEEAAYVLADCGAKVVVIHADLLRKLQRAMPPGALVLQVETPAAIREAYGISAADGAPLPGVAQWS